MNKTFVWRIPHTNHNGDTIIRSVFAHRALIHEHIDKGRPVK